MASPTLDRTFSALADPVRRGILERLVQGDTSAPELAKSFGVSVAGLRRHLTVLERAGLVSWCRQGSDSYCRLNAAPMRETSEWIAFYRMFWT